jgi:undecaprenyl phosphate N,N'-diacetylbacillosamine 1-phosphate transferase
MRKTLYSLYLKRFIDFNLALIALIVFSPFLLFIIILQIFFNGFPLFFIQERVGKDENIFKLIKFRTMNNNKDKYGSLLTDNQRLTWFGNFLRKTSIDEIPSLINILKGDMSVVGPRPFLVDYLQLYNKVQKQRHVIRPGLSGLAQIKGRNKLSWSHKFRYDIFYIKKINLLFDIYIILKTFIYIFQFDKVNSSHTTTMEKFRGDN